VSWLRVRLRESALAFVVSTIMLPGAIAVATVFLFLTSPSENDASAHWSYTLNRTPTRVCCFGLLLALGFCALLAVFVCRRFVRAESACPGPFTEICHGLDRVKVRLAAASGTGALDPLSVGAEATEHCRYLDGLLARPSQAGLPWLLASGYVDAWQRLHSIDEAMLFLDPVPLVVRDALTDEMRLEGSNIPQSAALLKRLRVAVASLSQAGARYLVEAPLPGDGANASAPDPADEYEARAALAQVRSAIAEFRDSRREGLIRGRNRLFATVIFEGVTGCVLLFVAILSGAPKTAIAAAAAFYLVGGVVGLVKQLQSAAAVDTVAQEDYGLGVVRLIQTPLFSGLAGVAGVVLVMLAQGQGQGAETFSLANTFNLNMNPYGLVAAGVFGLTPALLLSNLQQRADQYRTDLSKSGASESRAPSNA
jgi:hypothetical protein